jgi:hypothetical protein
MSFVKLNIVNLIEKNPITKLSNTYQNRFLEKIQQNFTGEEQQLFLSNFYTFLNYHQYNDYVISLENVFKWVGFSRLDNAKKVLTKNFIIDIDYKIEKKSPESYGESAPEQKSIEIPRAHGNKEFIYMNVNTFKKFCLKAGTSKADQIHDYYIKLETLIHQVLEEESEELRQQLIRKDEALMNKIEEYNKLKSNHDRILYKRNRHTLKKGKCLYLIKNVDINHKYKFGISDNLNSRVSHYKTYDITDFLFIIFTEDNKLLEDCIKRKFKTYLVRQNSEWLCNLDVEIVIDFITNILDILGIENTQYTNIEELIINEEEKEQSIMTIPEEIKENIITEIEEKKEIQQEIIIEQNKKCNKCLLTLDKSSFNKDRTKKDGLHTTCRLCEKENKKRYLESKKENMSKMTEKKCLTCDKIKDISHYTQHIYTKDGFVNHCKECIQKNSNSKRQTDKENNIRYLCGTCNTSYSRKDTLTRHQKICLSNVTEK